MVRAELEALYDLCAGKRVVELGSYVGMSSYVLAHVARGPVMCVDLWPDGWAWIEPKQRAVYEAQAADVPSVWEAFQRNTRPVADRLFPLRQATAKAALWFSDGSVEALLVDADHSRQGVADDLAAWLPKVVPGGLVLLHDYVSSWPGVAQAAAEAPLEHLATVRALGVFRLGTTVNRES